MAINVVISISGPLRCKMLDILATSSFMFAIDVSWLPLENTKKERSAPPTDPFSKSCTKVYEPCIHFPHKTSARGRQAGFCMYTYCVRDVTRTLSLTTGFTGYTE